MLHDLKQNVWKTASLNLKDVKKLYRYIKYRKMIEPDVYFVEQFLSFNYYEDMALIKYKPHGSEWFKENEVFFKFVILNEFMIKLIPEDSDINYHLIIVKHGYCYSIMLYYKDTVIFKHQLEKVVE